MPDGHASVAWLKRGITANEELARLRVLDRQLVRGDVVARVEGGNDQVGTISAFTFITFLAPVSFF